MTYGEHLSIVKLLAERDCYRECLDKLRSAVMGRDVTVRGMGDKQLHEVTDEAVDAVRTLLMSEGCESHGVVETMLRYRRVLNGVCKRLGLTDGTGKPEQDGVIYGELEKRLMPEGMEWPRYESGAPVLLGSMVSDARGGSAAAISFELSDDRVYIRDFEGFPSQVLATGERVKCPEADSWERVEDDATKQPYAYCVERGLDDDALPTNEKFARDLVRRCKALAGVSE